MRGSVNKVGSSWYVVYDKPRDRLTGERKQKKKGGFKTKKEAEKFLNEQLNALNKGTYFEPSNMTLSEYLDYWLENHAKPNNAQRTFENYHYMILQHIKPTLGHFKLSKLQPENLQEYYAQKLCNGKIDGGGLSAQSVKHHHRVIFKALKDAVKWQLVIRNVAEAVTPPKTKKVEMHTWDNEQVKDFMEVAKSSPYYPIYLTAIYTGMRRGEIRY